MMGLPFRRSATPVEMAISSYWDDLVLNESSGEILPVSVDPALAGTIRKLHRQAAIALQSDRADSMLDHLLAVHQEHRQTNATANLASTARPKPALPDRRDLPATWSRAPGLLRLAPIVLALALIAGVVGYALLRESGPDSGPAEVPAIVIEDEATPDATASPESSRPGEVMINPAGIEAEWQWDLVNSGNLQVDKFLRVVVSPSGEIFAVDTANSVIHILDDSGTETGTWGKLGLGPGEFDFGNSNNSWVGGDIDFDADGNIYVFDGVHDRIQKFTPDRQYLMEWSTDSQGSETHDFDFPVGAVDPISGRVYVVTEAFPKVQVFDLEGNLLLTWGSFGGGEGQFRKPSDVAIAPDGTVWISDLHISRIQHFDAEGNYLGVLGGERSGEPGQFNQVSGLFIDDDYNIYVADYGNGRVQVVRPDGTPLLAFNMIGGTDRLAGAYSLWVDEEGSLFVADAHEDRVLKLKLPALGATTDGSPVAAPAVIVNPDSIEVIWQWDLPEEFRQNDGFDQFLRVAVSPDGEILAVDPDAHATIHLLDGSGTETGSWGGPGQEPGKFDFALVSSANQTPGGDFDFDAEGNLYVFDSGNDRIQKFSPDRQFLMEWTIEGNDNLEYNKPLGAVDPVNGKVYVVTETNPRVQVFDLEGNLLTSWGEFGGKEGQFRLPSDVAVAPDGTVWISDRAIARIQHFDPDGNYLGMIGGERGGDPGQFNQVTGLFIDDNYNIYVADFGNGRIQVVQPDGTPLLVFNIVGGTRQITSPFALWVDSDGALYVGDSYDDKILKLKLPPLGPASNAPAASTPTAMLDPNDVEASWEWTLPAEEGFGGDQEAFLRVAVSPSGEIHAVDTVGATIHLLDENGVETGTWGEIGTGPQQFSFYTQNFDQVYGGDIDFDADGNIYVFDSMNDRIQKYGPDQQFLKEWPVEAGELSCENEGLGGEEGAIDCFPLGAVDPVNERVYVVTELIPKVLVFDLEGNLLNTWGEFGGGEGQFRQPSDVAVAPDGTVWISDKGIARIQQFDPDGNYLGMLGGERSGEPGQFNQITGLFIDDDYNIYVADFGNGRVQVVRPDGTPLLAFSTIGGTDRLAGVYSLWVDDEGALYVADAKKHRVLKLQLPPLT